MEDCSHRHTRSPKRSEDRATEVHARRDDRGSIFDRYYASSVGPRNLQRIRQYGGCVATGGGAAWGIWGCGCRGYRPTFGVYGPALSTVASTDEVVYEDFATKSRLVND